MTDVAPEPFDAGRAKAQVAAVSKLALPYLLDACDEIDRLQHIIDCADTPLMRDVMRERDACAELLRWQPHTERGLSNLHPQHRAAVERARALTAEETKEAENG